MHHKCCNEWLNLIFESNGNNLRNNGKYWITGILSEILCRGSIGWALSLSLGSKQPKPPEPRLKSHRAWALGSESLLEPSLWTTLIINSSHVYKNLFSNQLNYRIQWTVFAIIWMHLNSLCVNRYVCVYKKSTNYTLIITYSSVFAHYIIILNMIYFCFNCSQSFRI
jgi:hypothetical protein